MCRELKVLSVLVFCLSFFGCSSLQSYNPRTRIKQNYIWKFQPLQPKQFGVEDENWKIHYTPTVVDSGVHFKIENKSKEKLSIVWSKSFYTDHFKVRKNIFSQGTEFSHKNYVQDPTVIEPQEVFENFITPVDGVELKKLNSYTAKQWVHRPICGKEEEATSELNDRMCMDKTFSFLLVLRQGEKETPLTFSYKLVGKTVKPKK